MSLLPLQVVAQLWPDQQLVHMASVCIHNTMFTMLSFAYIMESEGLGWTWICVSATFCIKIMAHCAASRQDSNDT